MAAVTVQAGMEEALLVNKMYRSLRASTVWFLIWGVVSLVFYTTFNPDWGIILILLAVLSWRVRIPQMFAVYAVAMGWSAFSNTVLAVADGQLYWLGLSAAQIAWTVSLVRELRTYKKLRLPDLYQARLWPSDSPPPQDEAAITKRFTIASFILSILPWVLGPALCLGLTLWAFMQADTQGVVDPLVMEQPWVDKLMSVSASVFEVVPVLALALGVAALISPSPKRKLAVCAVVISTVFLVILTSCGLISLMGPLLQAVPEIPVK